MLLIQYTQLHYRLNLLISQYYITFIHKGELYLNHHNYNTQFNTVIKPIYKVPMVSLRLSNRCLVTPSLK